MKKIIFVLTLIFFISNNSSLFAQQKPEKVAERKIEKMDQKLKDAGFEAGLSDEQKTKLKTLYIDEFNEIAAITETDENLKKEKSKEINKKYGKLVHQNILNKEQKELLKNKK